MAELFTLKIVTPERTVLERKVVSVTAPGADGSFGVLAHHAPMLAEIGVGRLGVTEENAAPVYLAVCGGFAYVGNNEMTILTEAAEFQNEIDIARAEQSAERARTRLESNVEHIDVSRAHAALHRALNRITVATR